MCECYPFCCSSRYSHSQFNIIIMGPSIILINKLTFHFISFTPQLSGLTMPSDGFFDLQTKFLPCFVGTILVGAVYYLVPFRRLLSYQRTRAWSFNESGPGYTVEELEALEEVEPVSQHPRSSQRVFSIEQEAAGERIDETPIDSVNERDGQIVPRQESRFQPFRNCNSGRS